MKPIKLIMSALGPYAAQMPAIDFTRFTEKGLFLISGETGSGKTMIFDALCYALFGTTSGSYRKTSNMRSEYADPKTKSYVEFYFSHQGKNYHIYRQFPYERPKLRGTGTKKENEIAILYPEVGDPVEGISKVNEAIEALLHINAKQFKQIAMIAQGEFWELLNASTNDRTNILRSIFMTEGYKSLAAKLENGMKDSYGLTKNTERSIVQYFGDVQAYGPGTTSQELVSLQKNAKESASAWNIKDMLQMLETVQQELQEQQTLLTQELKLQQSQQKKHTEKLTLAENTNKKILYFHELQETQKKLSEQGNSIKSREQILEKRQAATRAVKPVYDKQLQQKKDIEELKARLTEFSLEKTKLAVLQEEATKKLNLAKEAEVKVEGLQKEINSITQDKENYGKRDQLAKDILQLASKEKQSQKKQLELLEQEKQQKEKIISLQTFLNDNKNVFDTLNQAQNLEELLMTQGKKIKKIIVEDEPNYRNQVIQHQKAQEIFTKARKAYEKALEQRIAGERVLEGCHAGLLAQKLVAEQPCPVCGSKVHPHKAILPETAISEADLEKLKSQELKTQRAKDQALLEVSQLAGAQDIADRLSQDIKECLVQKNWNYGKDLQEATIEDVLQELPLIRKKLQNDYQENHQKVVALTALVTTCKEQQEQLDKLQGVDRDRLQQQLQTIREELSQITAELAEKRGQYSSVNKLPYENWDMAQKQLASLTKEVTRLKKAVEQAESDLKNIQLKVTANDSIIQENTEHLTKQQKTLEVINKECLAVMTKNHIVDLDEYNNLVANEKILTEEANSINSYYQKIAVNKQQIAEVEKEIKGKTAVDLTEMESQSQKFDELINDLQDKLATVTYKWKTNDKSQTQILQQEEGFNKAQHNYQIYAKLYKLVSGMTGNIKITLEQYVQATGFDQIIRAANRRLLPMSNGQYELYRKDDVVSRQSNTFLDLEVLDNYTGHRRAVGNLSGGESFKASLSLALGLSDTVSSHLGGVQMDALFIDEGFGTLDKNSIDKAMDILLQLSNANKLVGIISHREELLETIPQQIKVYKSPKGSNFQVQDDFNF